MVILVILGSHAVNSKLDVYRANYFAAYLQQSDILENQSVQVGDILLVAWPETNFSICQHFY